MRFRTKLLITSLAIVVIPLILSVGTYLALGRYLVYKQQVQKFSGVDYGMVSDPGGTFAKLTDSLVVEITDNILADPFILEDVDYLEELDSRVASKYCFISILGARLSILTHSSPGLYTEIRS